MKAWINGKFISENTLNIPTADEGVRYGNGVFETLRIYHGYPFMLNRHLERMSASLRFLRCELPYPLKIFTQAVKDLVFLNGITDGVLRIYVTAGGAAWIVTANGIPYSDELYRTGIKAVFSTTMRNESSPLVSLKSFNYLDNILAKREAQALGCQEALFKNTRGFLAEGSASNIFLVSGNALITPSADSGLFSGITREIVLAIAPGPVEEREVAPEELRTANECFLTNSLMEIMPLAEVDGKPVGRSDSGRITRELMKKYRELTTSHCIELKLKKPG